MGMPDDAEALLHRPERRRGRARGRRDRALSPRSSRQAAPSRWPSPKTPAEGELLLAGRRQVLTAMEKLGTTDDRRRLRAARPAGRAGRADRAGLGRVWARRSASSAMQATATSTPTWSSTARIADQVKAAQKAFDDIMLDQPRARRHDHRRARGRHAEDGAARARARRRCPSRCTAPSRRRSTRRRSSTPARSSRWSRALPSPSSSRWMAADRACRDHPSRQARPSEDC